MALHSVERSRRPAVVSGRQRVSRCADPSHLDADGVCVRWSHLPGDGSGPVKPNRARRFRSFCVRASRHVFMALGVALAVYFAVYVVGPTIWGGLDVPAFDGGGLPSDVPTGDVKPDKAGG